jgi:hypothetical protein
MLVGWRYFAVFRGFWAVCDTVYTCVCCHNRSYDLVVISLFGLYWVIL